LGLEGQWGLKPIRGISTSPLLGTGGTIRYAHGYDEETGLWCHRAPEVTVQDRPTTQQARCALEVLREAFKTFPFGDAVLIRDEDLGVDVVDIKHKPELDESTHLVALMTSVCRSCLSLAPGFLYNAAALSGAGTGKGLLIRATSAVGNGT